MKYSSCRPPSFALLLAASLIPLFLLASPSQAENWPTWRGPDHNSLSSETGLATTWSKTEGVRWRLPLPGPGPSTPVVWGERIFLTSATASGEGGEVVLLAVDRAGEVLWQRPLGKENYDARQGESNAASPSPTTDGKHVWAMTGTGVLAAFTVDGEELWRQDLQELYGKIDLYFGHSSTPLVHNGLVFVQLLHGDAQLVLAFDAATGKEVWKQDRPSKAQRESLQSYASPIPWTGGGEPQVLIHGSDVLTAHRLEDGKELWRVGGLNDPESYNPAYRFVTSPTVAEGLLIVPSAKNGPVVGVEPGKAAGDGAGAKPFERWRNDRGTPDVCSPLIHDGLVYLNRSNGALVVLDAATGATVYQERIHEARHRASPVYADGKVYLSGSDGTVTVLRAGRKLEVLAKNSMEERIAASLAISDGTIYLRTYEALYAIGGSSAKSKADKKMTDERTTKKGQKKGQKEGKPGS